MFKFVTLIFLLLLSLLTLNGCQPLKSNKTIPTHLKIGLLPDRNPQYLINTHTPLFDHIATKMNITYEFVIPQNYNELLELFHLNKIDLAFFGGYTFITSHLQDGAVPLVMRNIDKRFTSYLITRTDSNLNNLEMLKNKTLAFGSQLSTSGHLMPRYYLSQLNIVPEDYFSAIKYSGSHDKTMEFILDKRADAGMINGKVYEQLIRDKPHLQKELRVLWQTPPYPDYVWAIQPQISLDFNQRLIDEFMSITMDSPNGNEILKKLNTAAFYPAVEDEFKELKSALMLVKPPHE